MKYFPYPDNRGQTHYEDCYRERRHHNCAVAEVDRLIAENRQLHDALDRIIHNAGYGGWDLQSAYAYGRKVLESVSTQQCQHSWFRPADSPQIQWGEYVMCSKCHEILAPEDLDSGKQEVNFTDRR